MIGYYNVNVMCHMLNGCCILLTNRYLPLTNFKDKLLYAPKIVSRYDQEKTTITNCRQTHGNAWKSHPTIKRHKEDKLSNETSSLSLSLPHQDCKSIMDIK